jgi:hypothetical protein
MFSEMMSELENLARILYPLYLLGDAQGCRSGVAKYSLAVGTPFLCSCACNEIPVVQSSFCSWGLSGWVCIKFLVSLAHRDSVEPWAMYKDTKRLFKWHSMQTSAVVIIIWPSIAPLPVHWSFFRPPKWTYCVWMLTEDFSGHQLINQP